jgi:hypothetical protein
MIHGVATWRCKCGVRVKVVTETDRSRMDEHTSVKARCPKCGDVQIVHAHRIITITTVEIDEAIAGASQ